jgi:hypothetical protein
LPDRFSLGALSSARENFIVRGKMCGSLGEQSEAPSSEFANVYHGSGSDKYISRLTHSTTPAK